MAADIKILAAPGGEWETALQNMLRWWQQNTIDHQWGGFVGRVENDNTIHHHAEKGAVLNARILWTFSAAARMYPMAGYLPTANRAFDYLRQYFTDHEHGGVYWSLSADGIPLHTKKQVYAQAFAIYAYAEYFLAKGHEEARHMAIALYRLLEAHSYDPQYGGYVEAHTQSWQPIADLRLSDKDANEPKSMNTHLHVLEAYTNLYRIWPDPALASRIKVLLAIFADHILDKNTGHLHLFFGMDWQGRSEIVSYGHDVEAAWLLQEAAEAIGDAAWIKTTRQLGLQMANAAAKGLHSDGGLWYEYDKSTNHFIYEKHWWPQAEALVGFYNAWQLSGETHWLEKLTANWRFITTNIIDHTHGEWFWGVDKDGNIMPGQDKAGFWKCPYHNGRALMELLRRTAKKAGC